MGLIKYSINIEYSRSVKPIYLMGNSAPVQYLTGPQTKLITILFENGVSLESNGYYWELSFFYCNKFSANSFAEIFKKLPVENQKTVLFNFHDFLDF